MNAKEVLAKKLQDNDIEITYLNGKRDLYKCGNNYYLVGGVEDKEKSIKELLQAKIEYYIKMGKDAEIELRNEFPCKDSQGVKTDERYDVDLYINDFLYNPKFAPTDVKNQTKIEEDIYRKYLQDYIKNGEYIRPKNVEIRNIFGDIGAFRLYVLKTLEIGDDFPKDFSLRDVSEMMSIVNDYKLGHSFREKDINDAIEDEVLRVKEQTEKYNKPYGNGYCQISSYDDNIGYLYADEEGLYKDTIQLPYISQLFREGKLAIDFDSLWKEMEEYSNQVLLENVSKEYDSISGDDKEYYIYPLSENDIQALKYLDEEKNKACEKIQLIVDFIPSEIEKMDKLDVIERSDVSDKIRPQLAKTLIEKIQKDFTINDFELYSSKDMNVLLRYNDTHHNTIRDEFAESDDKFRLILNIDHLSSYFEDRSVGIDGEFEEAFNDEAEIKDYIQELLGEGVKFRIEKCELTSFDEMKEQYWNKKSEPDYDYER